MKICKTEGCNQPTKSSRALYCHTCRPESTRKVIYQDKDGKVADTKTTKANLKREKELKAEFRAKCAHKGCRKKARKHSKWCGEHAPKSDNPIAGMTDKELQAEFRKTRAGKWCIDTAKIRQKSYVGFQGFSTWMLVEIDGLISTMRMARGRKALEEGQTRNRPDMEIEIGHLAPAKRNKNGTELRGSNQPCNLQLMTKEQNGSMGDNPPLTEDGIEIHAGHYTIKQEIEEFSVTELCKVIGFENIRAYLMEVGTSKGFAPNDNWKHTHKRRRLGTALFDELIRISEYLVNPDSVSYLCGEILRIASKAKKHERYIVDPSSHRKWIALKDSGQCDVADLHAMSMNIQFKAKVKVAKHEHSLLMLWSSLVFAERTDIHGTDVV